MSPLAAAPGTSRSEPDIRWRDVNLPPFERVVQQHGPTVLRVCRAVLGPTDAAEDAWSETFLSALGAYPRLRPDSNVEAWLVTIAHRKAIDVVRARRRRAVPLADVPERPSPHDRPDDPVRDRDPALWEALAALPDKQRHAVAYHHVAGLPHAEVAAILGGSEVAARKAASDGIKRLRGVLGSALQEEGTR